GCRATRQSPATSTSSRSQVSRTAAGRSPWRPWTRSASSSATGRARVAMSEPARPDAARESRDPVRRDEDGRGEDEHGEPEDGDGRQIAALVEVEDEHGEDLGLRGEEDHRRGKLAHHRDEDEAPGGDEARPEERRGHPPQGRPPRRPEAEARL